MSQHSGLGRFLDHILHGRAVAYFPLFYSCSERSDSFHITSNFRQTSLAKPGLQAMPAWKLAWLMQETLGDTLRFRGMLGVLSDQTHE